MALIKQVAKGHGLRLLLPNGQKIDIIAIEFRGPTDVLTSGIIRRLKVRLAAHAPEEVEILMLGSDGKPTAESLSQIAARRRDKINKERKANAPNHPG